MLRVGRDYEPVSEVVAKRNRGSINATVGEVCELRAFESAIS
jgi:hypothetical protein